MLLETLQAAVRVFYRVLGGDPFERRAPEATLGGFIFDPRETEPERTIVLVHGLGDAGTTWFKQVPHLREQARLVVVDLPPFGLSTLHNGYALGPREHARQLVPIVEEHAVGPTTIVGQSMGGWVTQWLLYDAPDLVDAAVLVATAGSPLEGSYDAVDLLTPHTPEETMAYLDALWYRQPIAMPAFLGEMMRRLHDPEIRAFLASTEHGHSLREKRLDEIEVPIHVVWGRDDGLLDPTTPAYIGREAAGNVTRSYLARAGHMVHQERPEALTRLIRHTAEEHADTAPRERVAPRA